MVPADATPFVTGFPSVSTRVIFGQWVYPDATGIDVPPTIEYLGAPYFLSVPAATLFTKKVTATLAVSADPTYKGVWYAEVLVYDDPDVIGNVSIKISHPLIPNGIVLAVPKGDGSPLNYVNALPVQGQTGGLLVVQPGGGSSGGITQTQLDSAIAAESTSASSKASAAQVAAINAAAADATAKANAAQSAAISTASADATSKANAAQAAAVSTAAGDATTKVAALAALKADLVSGKLPVAQVPTITSTLISDFVEAAQDAVALLLAGASGVTLSYNDAANTLTITGSGVGSGGLDAEAVRDAIGVALIGSGYISVLVNDAADTITITQSQALIDVLATKAPLASPAFTGTATFAALPTAPTTTPTVPGQLITKAALDAALAASGSVYQVVSVGTLAAAQAARDAIGTNGVIYFANLPGGASHDWGTTPLVFDATTKPGVKLMGPGLIKGSVTITGDAAAIGVKTQADYTVSLNFYRALDKTTYPVKGYADGSFFLKLDRVRNVEITGSTFYGAAYPVYIAANVRCGQHELSDIMIHHNKFRECDTAWRAEYDPASPGGWQCIGDSGFDSNTVNRSYYRGVDLDAIDGVSVSDNVFFMVNYSGTSYTNPRFKEKRQNLYVGESGWVIVERNKFFEAGAEAMLLDKVHNLATVRGNHYGWPGQVVPSDAARVISNSGGAYATGRYPVLNHSGNVGEGYSKSLLSVVGDWVSLTLGADGCSYDTTTSDAAAGRYIGTTETSVTQRRATLDALPHYRYDLSGVTFPKAPQVTLLGAVSDRINHGDRYPGSHPYTTSVQALAGNSTVEMVQGAALVPSLTFTAGTQKDVVQIRGGSDAFSVWSGRLTIIVEPVGGTKQVEYEVQVSKSAAGLDCLVLGAVPSYYTAGAAVDDPAFTIDINANGLVATPLGLTAGAFTWVIYSLGDLIVG